MLFKYIGNKDSMPNVYGYDFSGHRVVDVQDGTMAARKLGGNSHFEIVDPGADATKNDASVTQEPETTEPGPVNYGVFRTKENGEKYSKPDKVCGTEAEVDAYLSENGLTRDDRLILTKAK